MQALPLAVLVVDDNPMMTAWFEVVFEDVAGVDVRVVNTGAAALERLRSGGVDVLVTDLQMPGTHGLSVLETAQQEAPACVCIAMTAHSDVPTAVNALRAGAWDFLTKPLDVQLAQLVISRAAEVHRLREQQDVERAARVVFGSLRADQVPIDIAEVALGVLDADDVSLLRPGPEDWQVWHSTADRGAPIGDATANLGVARDLAPARFSSDGLHRLGYPLFSSNRLHGILWALRRPPRPPFTTRDVRLAGTLAGHVSLALDNVRLMGELRDRMRSLEETRTQLLDAARWEHVGRAAGRVAGRLETSLAYVDSHVRAAAGALSDDDTDSGAHLEFALEGLEQAARVRESLAAQAERKVADHDVRDLLKQAVQLAPASEIAVRISCEEGLVFHGHGGAVVQALVEVLDNAFRAVDDVPAAVVRVEARRSDEALTLSVHDPGPPIDVASIAPWVSAWGGAGLGLVIARDAVARVSGRIELHSGPSGTTASLVLPVDAS